LKDDKLIKELKEIVDAVEIFDTHEHIMYESERRKKLLDFFIIFNAYTITSLISAGLNTSDAKKLYDPNLDVSVKWDIFRPYWNFIKYSDDAAVIKIALRDLFGIDDINIKSIKKINEKLNDFNKSLYYKYVLREKCNIKFILNDIDKMEAYEIFSTEPDQDYFLPVIRLDHFFNINSYKALLLIENESNKNITKFSDLINIIDDTFEKRKNKIYAIKTAIAYSRDIFFDLITYHDAEKSFNRVLKLNDFRGRRNDSISLNEIRSYQDYLFHYILRKSMDYHLPVQIHTGMLDENENDINNSNPTKLINLFLIYKNVVFDIFHAGYPFTDELITMVKTFPNVYFNLCWIVQFSNILYKNIIKKLLSIVPINKIFGFGGDYLFAEGTYGAQVLARKCLADVLYEKIVEDNLSLEDAKQISDFLFFDNAYKVFKPGLKSS
jgi:hypothetical protein